MIVMFDYPFNQIVDNKSFPFSTASQNALKHDTNQFQNQRWTKQRELFGA